MITEQEVKSKTIERFWSKIEFDEPDKCWNWTACVTRYGYGKFKFRRNDKWVDNNAHRCMYEMLNGLLSTEQLVCHSCDNRLCCNPNHLWVGTIPENNLDRDSKNRQAFGERSGHRKIDTKTAIGIKIRLRDGVRSKDIQKEFNVNKYMVCDIKRGKHWNHVQI